MSIPVPPEELAQQAAGRGRAAYVITTSPDGRPHVAHQLVDVSGPVVRCTPGRSTLRNAEGGGAVVVLWQAGEDGYSLIADGTGRVEGGDGDVLAVDVGSAVLHRPAASGGGAPRR